MTSLGAPWPTPAKSLVVLEHAVGQLTQPHARACPLFAQISWKHGELAAVTQGIDFAVAAQGDALRLGADLELGRVPARLKTWTQAPAGWWERTTWLPTGSGS